MDSFELNKIAGAVLFALLVAFGLSIFSEIIFETEVPETPGYAIAVAETPAGGEHGGGEAPASEPIAVLLAKADAGAGEGVAKKCLGCHSFAQGEPNKTGPNLWEIVNRPIASHEGYEYSEPMHAFAEQAKTWDYEHLNAFLHEPAGHRAEDQDVVPRPEERRRAGQCDRLSPHACRKPRAAAASGGRRACGAGGAAAAPGRGSAAAALRRQAAPAEQQAAQPATPPAAPAAPAEPPAAPAEQQAAQPATPPRRRPPLRSSSKLPSRSLRPRLRRLQDPLSPRRRPAEAPAAPAAAPAGGFAALVAAGDVAKGQTFAKRCGACHTFEKDGANKVGPHLWGIVDRPIASVADFEYSPAMTEFAAGGKTWTYDELSAYLENPKARRAQQQDGVPGREEGGRPGQPHRLSAHAGRHSRPTPRPIGVALPIRPALFEGMSAHPLQLHRLAPDDKKQDPTNHWENGPMPIRLAAAAFLLAAIPTLSQAQEASAFAPLVAAADVAKGTTFAKRCAACHAFEKDAGNKVGPNLWGIVDRPIASVAGLLLFRSDGDLFGGRRETVDL